MTNRQKQNLLQYLGYYTGVPDGIWGNLSKQAAERFQRDYGLEVDGMLEEDAQRRILEVITDREQPAKIGMADWWKDIRYFTRGEFACKCGRCGGFPAEPDDGRLRLSFQVLVRVV